MDIKILIVDDEKEILQLLEEFLSSFDYKIDKADGVKSAIGQIDEKDYHVVITDKNMPGLKGGHEGGMEVLEHVKKYQADANVIMMTGYATIDSAIKAMKMGAFDYITKPISLTDFKDKIDRVLDYESFLNPDSIISIYRDLHSEMLKILENRRKLTDDDIHEVIKSLNSKMDHFFKAQREWERVIINQKEALDNIASYAAQLRESTLEIDPSSELIENISIEANRRL